MSDAVPQSRMAQVRQWSAGRGGVILVSLLAGLLLLPPASLPGQGLDPSWTLALEDAARQGRQFGQDFIFAYGPLGVLTTRMFDPGTWLFALLGDFVLTGLFLVPLFSWSRRPAVLFFYVVAILAATLAPLALDARIALAFLVVFLLAVRGQRGAALLGAALVCPFLLSKFSYFMIALPLFLLADVHGALRFRQLPLLTLVAVAELVLGMLLTGHSLAALPGLAANIMEVISGYGGAMQAAIGGIYPLLAAFAALLIILGLCLVAFVRRGAVLAGEGKRLVPLAILFLGLAWLLFTAFKMGHVRQDLHIFTTWHAFVLAVPVLAAFLDRAAVLQRRELIFAFLVLGGALLPIAALDAVNYLKFTNPSPFAYLRQRATDLVVRPFQTLSWLTPGQWRSMAEGRRAAEAEIAAHLPVPAQGTMDVIPFNVAPVIASAAEYRPRPLPQSYGGFTPRLQALDVAHFENSATAPATLFFQLGDIDERLPTLATGPSLPVIARWYDAVGESPLGLILRRRPAPRTVRAEPAGAADFALGDWVPVPQGGSLIVARVEIGPNLLGRALGFLAREPMIWITLRFAGGREQTFRYIPGMGRAGFVLSPMTMNAEVPVTASPAALRASAALIERSRAPDAVADVAAVRFSSAGLGARSFGTGRIVFERLQLEPGFTAALHTATASAAPAPAPAPAAAAPAPTR